MKPGVIRVLLFFVFLLFPIAGKAQPSSALHAYVFYTENCASCQGILRDYLPTLQTLYPFLDVKLFDAGNPAHYGALTRLEEKFGRRGNEFPLLFIGDQMFSGGQEIMEKLEPLILDYQLKGDPVPPLPPVETGPAPPPSEKAFSVDLAYFYQKGCPKCDRANSLLKYLAGKYPRLRIREIDLNTPEGKRLNETLSSRVGLPSEKRLVAPSVFIGKDYVPPEMFTESNMEALIRKYEKEEEPSALEVKQGELQKGEASMVERYRSLGVATILAAGFIDGLNPCAFATLIFFISYLALVGRKRKEVLAVGLGFSGAVFATYLLIGLGLFRFIQHLSFLPLFSRIVYIVTILLALVLGILSLYDALQLKRGRSSEMKLQLPEFLKKRIHRTIREKSKSGRYVLAAVGAGVVISLLEFTCTGQVYLPTILFVMNIPSLRAGAFSYLILYNVFFILPLLIIFGIVYWGVTSEQLAFFLRKRAVAIKLVTAVLFFGLAGVLIVNYL
jgi:thiol-disulfide isomerase/thioredoxin